MLNTYTTYCLGSIGTVKPPIERHVLSYSTTPFVRFLGTREPCKYLRIETCPTNRTMECEIHGFTQTLPVWEATLTASKIPCLHSGYYRNLERTLICNAVYDILSRAKKALTVAQIISLLDLRCYSREGINMQIKRSKTEKQLNKHLHWLARQGAIKHIKPPHRVSRGVKRCSRWVKDGVYVPTYDRDTYIAYHGVWAYINTLQQWGMRVQEYGGLASVDIRALRHVEETLQLLQEKSVDEYNIAQTMLRWIRYAPWNHAGAVDMPSPPPGEDKISVRRMPGACKVISDTFVEIWDGAKKIGDIWPELPNTSTSDVRAVENFLRAHLVYPYNGRVVVDAPVVCFRDTSHWNTSYDVGTYVWFDNELRIITQTDGDRFRLSSLGPHRRPFKKWFTYKDVRLGHVQRGPYPNTVYQMRRMKCQKKYTFKDNTITYFVECYLL